MCFWFQVMIIGAGGRLGLSILSAFEADSRFTVSVLTRRSSKSSFPSHINVVRIADNYPEAALLEAFRGQDAVISSIAIEGAPQQKAFIDAAVKAGVKRFVPSEFGSDTLSEAATAVLPQVFRGKRNTVLYLKEKEREGLTWTAFVTGPFFELFITAGFMGFNPQQHKVTIFNDGNQSCSTTTLTSIGLAVKNAMLIPDETANKYLFIHSFTVSQNQVLASCEKATGNKWEVTYVDIEEEKKVGLEKISNGDSSGFLALVRYINYAEGHGGNYAKYRETANEILSLPNVTLDVAVASILSSQQAHS